MNTPGASDSGLELARPVDVLSLTHGDSQHTLRASAAECEALAKRFSVDQLQHLTATLTLTRSGSEKSLRIRVQGSLDAAIVQTCVVSLEPFPSHIVCEIDAVFDARAGQETTHQDLDPLAEEPPEPIVDGHVDLGELVAQCLSLEIDPHPRKPGEHLAIPADQVSNRADSGADSAAENPFAVLKNLKFDGKT